MWTMFFVDNVVFFNLYVKKKLCKKNVCVRILICMCMYNLEPPLINVSLKSANGHPWTC